MFAVHPPLQVLAITCFALGDGWLIAYMVISLGYLEEYLGKCLDKELFGFLLTSFWIIV